MTALHKLAPLLLATVLPLATAAAAPIFPGASGVGLEPPPGMHVATGFNGFQDGPASIVVTELPKVAYAAINAQRDGFAARFKAQKAADVEINGAHGFLVKGSQPSNGKELRKWIVVLDGAEETALVTAQVPVDDAKVSDAAIEAALNSIAFRPRPGVAEQVAALPFVVGDLSGFRPSGTALGAALILVDGPKDVDPNQSQAQVVVTMNGAAPPADGRAEFAKSQLQAFQAVRTTQVESARLFDADGAQWAEVLAKGSEGPAETPVALSFYIRFGKTNFVTIVCVAPVDAATRDAPRFRTLALSVKPKG